MAIVKERIVLRKSRRKGERMPHRIKLDELQPGDSLLVEIVIDKEQELTDYYLFEPEQLEKRKSVAFRVSGDKVYWLSSVTPKPLLGVQAERLYPQIRSEKTQRGEKSDKTFRTKDRRVLVFNDKGVLISICHSLRDVAGMTNLREKAIDKLCKSKRPSFETGLSFRYWWKILDFDITDFTLTAFRYDQLCKRNTEKRNK